MGKASRKKGTRQPKKLLPRCIRCKGAVEWPGPQTERARKLRAMWKGDPAPVTNWCVGCVKRAKLATGTAQVDDSHDSVARMIADLEALTSAEE